jgi:hypothetical protein
MHFFMGYNDAMAQNNDPPGDNVYKWTVRALYAAAISLNVWYMVEQMKGTPEGVAMNERAKEWVARIRHPFNEAKRFRRMADETVVEAWVIVDEANKESEKDNEE